MPLITHTLLTLALIAAFTGGKGPFAVIAYYNGHGRGLESLPAEKLTHIIYSFLHLKGNRLASDGARDTAAIGRLIALKQTHPGLKVMLSLGGWGGCAPCSEVFATAEGRREFAQSVREALARLRADGIDLDWEYPAFEGYPGHRFTAADRHNFTMLVQELRRTLGEGFEVSFAAAGFTDCILASYEWDQLVPLVDRVNVMTYDLVNANSVVTGHLTPLRSTPMQRESVENAVRLLDSLGVPRGKIVIGSAFYARLWQGVPDSNHGLFQNGKFLRYVNYRDLDAAAGGTGGFVTYRDSTAEAPFRYSAARHTFATYDDPRSAARKTEYAIRERLGGIMFWEITGDSPADGLLDAIDSVVQARR